MLAFLVTLIGFARVRFCRDAAIGGMAGRGGQVVGQCTENGTPAGASGVAMGLAMARAVRCTWAKNSPPGSRYSQAHGAHSTPKMSVRQNSLRVIGLRPNARRTAFLRNFFRAVGGRGRGGA